MITGPDAERIRARLLIWWIIWGAVLSGLIVIYYVLGRVKLVPPESGANLLLNLIGFVPLFLSVVIRWLVLPRATGPQGAFVMFILGLGLAEACGFLGIFLGGPYREDFFVLGVMGVTQYAPFYAKKFYEPKGSGFIPNN